MTIDELFARRAVVFASAIVYWGGVFILARRIRKRIGRSPNLKPRTPKEKLLWLGWLLVIVLWMGQPFLIGKLPGFHLTPSLLNSATLAGGLLLTVAGYAATLWCYRIMGNNWRIGINRKEKNALVTEGPYRFVRHPIYAFQIVMLSGVALLLPTIASAVVLVVHIVCALSKALDEEAYLLTVHGDAYRDYLSRTGRLLPKL